MRMPYKEFSLTNQPSMTAEVCWISLLNEFDYIDGLDPTYKAVTE